MTLRIRKGDNAAAFEALATELNLRREAAVGANVHYSTSRLPSGAALGTSPPAAASSLETSRVLANWLRAVCNQHFADRSAHGTVFTAAVALGEVSASLENVAKLAAIVALANQIKSRYESNHRATASVHPNNDATNAIAAADATDQTSVNTLLNEMRTEIPAHIILALAGNHIEFVDA
jgi:hypothetical protein